jgi:methyl-accepting chemotaxis protein
VIADALNKLLRDAENIGSWAEYAVHVLGDSSSGIEELDTAIAQLYSANENVHRIANKLALRYDVDFFEGH